MEEALALHSGDTLGKDWLFSGNPLGNLSDARQGSSERGNVECADSGLVW